MYNTSDYSKEDLLNLLKHTNFLYAKLSKASALIYNLQSVNSPHSDDIWTPYSEFFLKFNEHMHKLIDKIETIPD